MSTYVIGGTVKSIKYDKDDKIDTCYFAPDQEFVVKTNYTNYKYHCAVLLSIDDEESTFSFKLNESECLELENIKKYSFLRVNGHYILELSKGNSKKTQKETQKNVCITIFSKKFNLVSITEIP